MTARMRARRSGPPPRPPPPRAGRWRATGGHGISIDSRTVAEGDLFVALSAARDGHDFVADALAKGPPPRWSPACPRVSTPRGF
jgi:hypothetical protein